MSLPLLCVSWTNGHQSATISDVPVYIQYLPGKVGVLQRFHVEFTASGCSGLPKSNEEMLKVNKISTQHTFAFFLAISPMAQL